MVPPRPTSGRPTACRPTALPGGAAAPRPLDGYRVLDVTANVAGPLAGQVLADLGAEVIKIEPPIGEAARHLVDTRRRTEDSADNDTAPVAPFFLTNNRGKKSVTLDLRTREGHEQAMALVETADVFLEAFRPGVLQRLGLGPEQVRARNPRCVYASLTAYGDGGPNGRRPGVDLMVQAESGALTGLRDGAGAPLPIGFQFIDGASGHVLAQSVLAALLQRERHGIAEVVKVSLYDVACSLQSAHLTMMLNETPAPPRPRTERAERPKNRAPGMPLAASPSGIFPAADGHLVIAAYVPKHWEILCAVLDRGDLAEDPRFADPAARSRNNAALAEELSATFATRPAAEWVARLQDAGLMASRVLNWREVVTSDLFGESRIAARAGEATVIRTPARYAGFEPATGTAAAPGLGEHNAELLGDRLSDRLGDRLGDRQGDRRSAEAR